MPHARRALAVVLALVLAAVALPPLYYAVFPAPAHRLPPAGERIPLAEGVSVNALIRGSGPPVVLVHGLPGSAYDWAPLLRALARRGVRVLAYDRLGYGHSDPRPGDDFTVEANARDLLALLAARRLQGATLVGWSYGGAAVMRAALEDASRVAGLVLIGSAGRLDDPPESPPGADLIFSPPVLAWAGAVPPVGRAMERALSLEAFGGGPLPAWWLPQLDANLSRPETRRTWLAESERFRWSGPDPAPLELPVLVIHGDADRLAPPAVGRWLHARARHAELRTVEGGSHMLPITHPELLAEWIAAFVRRAAAAPPGSPAP